MLEEFTLDLRPDLAQITPSLTLVLKAKVEEMRSNGVHVISFTVGEPDFPTPTHIKQAGVKAIEDNFTRYTSGLGITELREAIAEKFRRENNLNYRVDNIIVSSGGKQAISSAIMALVRPGDEVLIPRPYWLSYPAMVTLAGGISRYIDTKQEDNYIVTAQALEDAFIKYPKAKLLILNSPSNPTGSVYTAQQMKDLVPIIRQKRIAVISDEIYETLLYSDTDQTTGKSQKAVFTSLASFEEIKRQIVVVNGVSKSFAMTGWRIGYAAAEPYIIKAMNKIQSHLTGNACSISQKAALHAIQTNLKDRSELQKMQETFQKRRDLACKLIREIPNLPCQVPQGAFYLFPDCSAYFQTVTLQGKKITNSVELVNYLLDVHHVSMVPGADFGMDTNFRISFATSEKDIQEGMNRINTGLKELRKI